MADETKEKSKKKTPLPKNTNHPLIGSQTTPTTLNTTTKLDIDTEKKFVDNILDATIVGGLDTSAIENFTSISNSRDQIYQLIDTMSQDSMIAAILRVYTENVCETGDTGHIV